MKRKFEYSFAGEYVENSPEYISIVSKMIEDIKVIETASESESSFYSLEQPLFDIAQKGDKYLRDLNLLSETSKRSILRIPINKGSYHVTKFLLSLNVFDINKAFDSKVSYSLPLLNYVAKTGNTKILELLLDKGAFLDLGSKDDIGGFKHPMILAIEAGHTDCVKLLIDRGVSIYAVQSKVPLMVACEYSRFDIVQLLLDRGYEFNQRYELYALQKASSSGSIGIGKLLLDRGVDVNKSIGWGKKLPINLAAYNGHSAMVKFLIDHKADANKHGGPFLGSALNAAINNHYNHLWYNVDKVLQAIMQSTEPIVVEGEQEALSIVNCLKRNPLYLPKKQPICVPAISKWQVTINNTIDSNTESNENTLNELLNLFNDMNLTLSLVEYYDYGCIEPPLAVVGAHSH